jgi:hypothetical protein
VRQDTEFFVKFGNIEENVDNRISFGKLFIEISSIYLLTLDKFIFSNLGGKNSDQFYQLFQNAFMAFALVANYGEEDAYAVQGAFISDLNKSINVYYKLPLVSQKENPNEKGTQMYELTRNIAKIIQVDKNILVIQLIEFHLLKNFTNLNSLLKKLLSIN